MDDNKYVAVIQAGGKGTRMVELTKDLIPKPMLEMNGKPMLQWQIENLCKYGFKEFVIIVGHLGNKIIEYFEDGAKFGVKIRYIEEQEPLGSAGALCYLKDLGYEKRDIALIFGDVMFDIDWNRMISFHEEKNALSTLFAHPNEHPYDSDVLLVDKDNVLTAQLSKKEPRTFDYHNLVNSGLYIIRSKVVEKVVEPVKTDLEKDLLFPLIDSGRIIAYISPEYVKDAGTPERFKQVSDAQAKGVWEQRNLENKQKCIFIDRDGTLNKFVGHVDKPEKLVLEEAAGNAVKMMHDNGYLVIVITNQPVVARGMCSIEDVENIHKHMEVLLGEQGTYVDDIFYCPHHPDKGYPEENPIYKVECNCRKPKTGLIDRAVEKYNIDLSKSYMVGDSWRDIETGKNAGVKTILVETGEGLGSHDSKPDFVAKDLVEAVTFVEC